MTPKKLLIIFEYSSEESITRKILFEVEMMKSSTKKMAKSGLAMVLAGSFVFSASAVHAEEPAPKTIDLQAVMDGNEPDQAIVETEPTAETDQTTVNTNLTTETDQTTVDTDQTAEPESGTEEVQQNDSDKAPSLVLGDFFYFVKVALEKIKLAFTLDDAKEAKLLAEFATERLAEAEELFAKGEEERALETINKALESIQGSEAIIEETTPEQDEATVEESEGQVSEEDVATVDNDESAAEEPSGDNKTIEETEKLMSQNIIALKAAMEKVKNPVAKAALQKNIDKSYAKLAKKLEKFEDKKKNKKKEQNENVTIEQTVAADEETSLENNQTEGNDSSAPTNAGVEAGTSVVEENTASTPAASEVTADPSQTTAVQPAPVQPAPDAAVGVKEQKAVERAEAKQEKQEAKAVAKEEKFEAKETKQAAKEEAKGNKQNGQGNGHKEDK